MKTIRSLILLSMVLILISGFEIPENPHKDWFKAGSNPENYKSGLDELVVLNGKKSLFIESTEKTNEGFGTIMQVCEAKDYLGKRIKMTGYIKSENVTDWTGMWLRIDPKSGETCLGFDNMQDRAIKGNSDWTKCEIIMDVPEESGALNFGVLLSGSGKVWFDNISFEIIEKVQPEIVNKSFQNPLNIDNSRPRLERPSNLNFEE
jgi:hypothetical protein